MAERQGTHDRLLLTLPAVFIVRFCRVAGVTVTAAAAAMMVTTVTWIQTWVTQCQQQCRWQQQRGSRRLRR
jgi:hypothetical protein